MGCSNLLGQTALVEALLHLLSELLAIQILKLLRISSRNPIIRAKKQIPKKVYLCF